MQKTSKWQTHLPYLHLETLRVHNSFSEHCTEFMQETSTRTPSGVTELVGNAHALTPVERSSINFCRSQVPDRDNNQTKDMLSHVKKWLRGQ